MSRTVLTASRGEKKKKRRINAYQTLLFSGLKYCQGYRMGLGYGGRVLAVEYK
jgi:hypothetical protein